MFILRGLSLILIIFLYESSGLLIRRGRSILHRLDNQSFSSDFNIKHRDWVNEIKEEIKLSKLANSRISDQLNEGGENEDKQIKEKVLTFGAQRSEGEICQRRVEMVVSKVYDEKIECKDTVIQKCVAGYSTKYKAVKVKQCTEDFKKSCHITYFPVTIQKEVKICEEQYNRVCNSQRKLGEEICVDVPSTVCVSSLNSETNHEEVECTQEVKRICGPDTCALEKSEVCVKEIKNIIQEIPKENCQIHPTQTCRNVTKLVPNLRNAENCLEIPKEVCQTLKVNHRSVEKPVSNIICKQSKGKWGLFGEWTKCVGRCGEGTQYRERKCESGDCNGFATESRSCDTGIPCVGTTKPQLDISSFEIQEDQIDTTEQSLESTTREPIEEMTSGRPTMASAEITSGRPTIASAEITSGRPTMASAEITSERPTQATVETTRPPPQTIPSKPLLTTETSTQQPPVTPATTTRKPIIISLETTRRPVIISLGTTRRPVVISEEITERPNEETTVRPTDMSQETTVRPNEETTVQPTDMNQETTVRPNEAGEETTSGPQSPDTTRSPVESSEEGNLADVQGEGVGNTDEDVPTTTISVANAGELGDPAKLRRQDGFGECARSQVRFISNDNIKHVALPPNGDVSDKVRLCEIICLQKEGCQFYHTDVGNVHSSCTLFRAISDIVEGAEGFVAGIRHCLEKPIPVEDEIIENA